MRRSTAVAAALLMACGGGSGPSVNAERSAGQVAQEFMRAVRDSNVTRMAELWGTARGPASETHSPAGYEKRVVVMQAWLRGDSARVVSDVADASDRNRRRVEVSLFRGPCAKQVPFLLIRTKSGDWVVYNVDIAKAGNPAHPCEQGS